MPINTSPRPSSPSSIASHSWTDRSSWGPSLYTPSDKARIEDRLNNLERRNHVLQSTIDSQHDFILRLRRSHRSQTDRLDRLSDWNADDARNIADLQVRQFDQQRDIRRLDNNSNTDADRIRRLGEEVSRLERDVGDQIFLKNNHVSLPSSSATTAEQVRTATKEFTADNSHTVVANDHPGKRKAHHAAPADNDRRPPPPPPVQTVTITNGGSCEPVPGTFQSYGSSSKRPRRAYNFSPPSSPLYSPTDPHYCDRDVDDHSVDPSTRTRYPRVYSPLYREVDDHSVDSLSLGSYPNAAFKHIYSRRSIE